MSDGPEPHTTRSRLLAATTEVIVERGWGGVSTRGVAERADVRPGVVHYHFGSVDDLKRQAGIDAIDAMFDPFLAMARTVSPRQLATQVVASAVQDYTPDTPEGGLIYEVMLAAARDPELQAGLRPILDRFRQALAGQIRRWHPSPTADPEILAELIGAAVDGLMMHLLVHPDLDLPAHLAPLLALLGDEVPPCDAPEEHAR